MSGGTRTAGDVFAVAVNGSGEGLFKPAMNSENGLETASSTHLDRLSLQAFWAAIFIALAISVSSVAAIIETVPTYYRSQAGLWFIFETAVVSIFTVEFLVRCYAHSTTWPQFVRFFISFYTITDLFAIVPYYLSLGMYGDTWADMQRFTVLRLFRLLRLFRCYTFSSLLQLSIDALVLAIKKSTDALVALVVFLVFIMVAFSTLLYFAERGVWDAQKRYFVGIDGSPSQFSSIPASFWFVAEIITTVGLGDIHPKTVLGKFITLPLMMFSLLIIALPSIVIGRNFAESWAWLRSSQPRRPSLAVAPILSTPTLPHSASPPAREEHFLVGLSTTLLPEEAPSSSVGEHGEVILGILQELQRQNQVLERLLLVSSSNQTTTRSRSSSQEEQKTAL
ncbi:Voltage-gated potassium channel [Paramicrosporidium saccamoebae]|uniref:Voltage-gated potassium channel n=1 Tax=Paramicrosporidium saccamoebae TaxID=1246581 RepID=A0A2H9TP34_9FUNG|nr:Voltage-gated potassium channel [Paramicrosporidium saccamoebae]